MVAYSQDDPVCYRYRRRFPSNETHFGGPEYFYVYVGYIIQHCDCTKAPSMST